MSKVVGKVIRYSDCFKRKIVDEISSGISLPEIRIRYGINGTSTLQRWLKKYGREELLTEVIYVKMRKESDRIKELEEENKRLKIALADATLAHHALEGLIHVANEHYGTDLKKNLGTKPSVMSAGKEKKA